MSSAPSAFSIARRHTPAAALGPAAAAAAELESERRSATRAAAERFNLLSHHADWRSCIDRDVALARLEPGKAELDNAESWIGSYIGFLGEAEHARTLQDAQASFDSHVAAVRAEDARLLHMLACADVPPPGRAEWAARAVAACRAQFVLTLAEPGAPELSRVHSVGYRGGPDAKRLPGIYRALDEHIQYELARALAEVWAESRELCCSGDNSDRVMRAFDFQSPALNGFAPVRVEAQRMNATGVHLDPVAYSRFSRLDRQFVQLVGIWTPAREALCRAAILAAGQGVEDPYAVSLTDPHAISKVRTDRMLQIGSFASDYVWCNRQARRRLQSALDGQQAAAWRAHRVAGIAYIVRQLPAVWRAAVVANTNNRAHWHSGGVPAAPLLELLRSAFPLARGADGAERLATDSAGLLAAIEAAVDAESNMQD